jgi:polygalacturonase
MAAKNVPVKERQMAVGENHFRPQFIQFNRCKNILIEDIKIINSPFWVIHLLKCTDGIVRRVNVFAHGSNNDGIDPEMTQNLLVEDCIFDQGDDAIAVKSGRNQDGWRLDTPSKNIVVRNCEIREGHQLLAIGSELSGGISNIYVHDCTFPLKEGKTSLNNVLFIKTNKRRGGYVENIYVENVKAGRVRGGVFSVKTDRMFQWRDIVPTYEVRLTKIRNITMKNIELDVANIAVDITAEKDAPVENVVLENITVHKVLKKAKNIENVKGFIEKNVVYGDQK